MLDIIMFILAVNALIFGWRKMWRPTYLDFSRDRLFDLRDGLRSYCIRNEIPLDDPAYVNLRMHLNNTIRFMDRASIYTLIQRDFVFRNDKDLQAYAQAELDRRFHTEDVEFAKFIEAIRQNVYMVTMLYFVQTAFIFSFINLFVAFVYSLRHWSGRISRNYSNFVKGMFESAPKTAFKGRYTQQTLEEIILEC